MTGTLFALPPPVLAPIRARAERFPIRRIFCVGRNYEAHAREMGVAADREANRSTSRSLPKTTCRQDRPWPTRQAPATITTRWNSSWPSARRDFASPSAHALDHVFGYACGLDMTRRDLQLAARERKARPWDLGKNFEQSAILGDIAPATDAGHPGTGRIELRVNGQTRQSADLSQLIHGVAAVVVASVAVLSPAAWRSDLHGHAGRRGAGGAWRSTRGFDRRCGHRHTERRSACGGELGPAFIAIASLESRRL